MPTFRFALRLARRSPGATALAALIIALAVGLTTALYSVLQVYSISKRLDTRRGTTCSTSGPVTIR